MIAGPTASGKSWLAMALAERLGGVVINADALQLYEDLRILTARPTENDERRIRHRLYGVLRGSQACSAGQWARLAAAEIETAQSQGAVPIVVGGTGLYLDALTNGLAPIPDIAPEIRAASAELYNQLGPDKFHRVLAARDPVAAARLPPGDRQRLTRAWEVVEATGRPLSDWHREATNAPCFRFKSLLLWPPRLTLYERCDSRFARMIQNGALEEVAELRKTGRHSGVPISKAIGVQELGAYLAGQATLEQATVAAQTATRHLAKRQATWFRHRFSADHTLTEKLYCKNIDNLLPKIT